MTTLSFERSQLEILNQRVQAALEGMPIASPLTLVGLEAGHFSDDEPVRRTVESACRSSESELRERIGLEYFGPGPLAPLLEDPDVTEIIVNGLESIWFEKRGKLGRWSDGFLSPLTYRNFISRLSREAAIQATLDTPFADGVWRGCRVHLAIPPVSGDQAVITIRRHPQNPWTLDRLEGSGWSTPKAIDELRGLIANKQNFLIVGGTGSGKTSVLNACLAKIEATDRTIIIEDTRELAVPNAASARLLTRKDTGGLLKEVDQGELLRQALRMRPDRIVMGEIRGGEAKDLLMAFATGHSGCMGTLHADGARQSLLRLEMLIQLGAPQWNLHAVRTLIFLSVKAIVVVSRTKEGVRRLEGIHRVAALEDVGFLLERVV